MVSPMWVGARNRVSAIDFGEDAEIVIETLVVSAVVFMALKRNYELNTNLNEGVGCSLTEYCG